MDFGFNDEQQAIKETARELLAKRSPLEKVREAAEARAYDDGALERDPRARLAGHRDPRGARRPGARHGRAGDPLRGARLRVRAGAVPLQRLAGPVIDQAGATSSGSAGCPGSPRARRAGPPRSSPAATTLVPDAAGAAVLVLNDGDGAVLVEAGDAEIEPRRAGRRNAFYARVSDAGGDPLPGDVEAAATGRWSRSPPS